MIAMLVGDDRMKRGPIPIAFSYAGFDPHPTATPDEAEEDLVAHGDVGCVLVIDLRTLEPGAGSAPWSSFLTGHGSVPAVVLAGMRTPAAARALAAAPHRIVLENPFDAAAVVAAARRVARR